MKWWKKLFTVFDMYTIILTCKAGWKNCECCNPAALGVATAFLSCALLICRNEELIRQMKDEEQKIR